MQRKNYILKTSRGGSKLRNGMAMIMAIVVLVVIATIMGLSLALTAQTAKRTTDMYLYEQAVLLSQSAAEYAMLKVAQQDPCKSLPVGSLTNSPSRLDFSYNDTFDINITMKYIAYDYGGASANNCISHMVAGNRYAKIGYEKSDGTIIMDITVSTQTDIATEPIRYFRRSVQKM